MTTAATDVEIKTVPDPSALTTAQLLRTQAAERDYVNGQVQVLTERLRGMDEATKVLSETVHRVPTDMQLAVGHLDEVMRGRFDSTDKVSVERFLGVERQFKERDTRSEREARDNKIAVDAAFAAQDKSATKQDEANQKAIDKSEKATNETIVKNAAAAEARADSISDKIDDLKAQITAINTMVVGLIERTAGGRESTADKQEISRGFYLAAGFICSLVLVAVALGGLALAFKK